PISENSWGRLARTYFVLTPTSILVRSSSLCNSRIGASGCPTYIPRMHGDQPLHRANSQRRTARRRLRAETPLRNLLAAAPHYGSRRSLGCSCIRSVVPSATQVPETLCHWKDVMVAGAG